jgi:endonuclease/exonuclease/phosphatase family metal-dependent hydrolase
LRYAALCAATTLLLSLASASGARAAELRLMTFNVKGDAAGLLDVFNREKSWYFIDLTDLQNPVFGPHRRDRAVATINAFGPDILSVQELKNNQRDDLLAAMPELSYYGEGRRGGELDDSNGIFYRTSRFDRVDQGSFWLSATPAVPGTTFVGGGTDTGNPRMATWVKLYDHESGQTYFVMSTHWSLDTTARNQSAQLIQNMLPALAGELPILLLGDFNATRSSTAVRTLQGLTNPANVQLTASFVEGGGIDGRTFHDWAGGISGSPIDHIFHSPGAFVAKSASIVRTTYDGGLYPSDHYPVTVTLRVLPEPTTLVLCMGGLAGLLVWSSWRKGR